MVHAHVVELESKERLEELLVAIAAVSAGTCALGEVFPRAAVDEHVPEVHGAKDVHREGNIVHLSAIRLRADSPVLETAIREEHLRMIHQSNEERVSVIVH